MRINRDLLSRRAAPACDETLERGASPREAPTRCGAEGGLLHEAFESRAVERPLAPAVVVGREATSYLGLERYANRLARYLRSVGVRQGARVGILLPPSMDAYAAMLGTLKAGAACVPVDPREPEDYVAHVLEHSEASALVTTTEHAHLRLGFRSPVVELDARCRAIAAEDPSRLPRDLVRAEPADLCFVYYVPAASGMPRGVMVEHRAAAHLARACARQFGIRPWDRVYQGSALSASESLQETWFALHAGAALVPRICASNRPRLARLLSRARISVLPCTPGLLMGLRRDVPSLRLVILAAGSCPRDLVARWSGPTRRIVYTYGHAETAMIATYAELLPTRPVTAGRPLPGCRVYVLDEHLRLVRYGGVGEICVGGAGVARGYLGRPADTRARFVRDPFAPDGVAEPRLYLTGDLGRITPNGELELHGPAPVVPGRHPPDANAG